MFQEVKRLSFSVKKCNLREDKLIFRKSEMKETMPITQMKENEDLNTWVRQRARSTLKQQKLCLETDESRCSEID